MFKWFAYPFGNHLMILELYSLKLNSNGSLLNVWVNCLVSSYNVFF